MRRRPEAVPGTASLSLPSPGSSLYVSGAVGFAYNYVGSISLGFDGSAAVDTFSGAPGQVLTSGGALYPARWQGGVTTLNALPEQGSVLLGTTIFVSDANSGVGTIAFANGTEWIDVRTGAAVA